MDGILKPAVSSYLDIYLYLQDIYQFRKKHEQGFSYEQWAKELGLTSKSYLRFAVLGKRSISEDLAQKICDLLQLVDSEREYFFLLRLYTQTSQPEQKRNYGRKLTQLLRESLAMTEVAPVDSVTADPLFLMIRNFLSFSGVFKSTKVIAKTFGIEISKTEGILSRLATSGFIEFKNEEWCALHENVKFSDKPHNETLQQFHRLSLSKAIQAQKMPFDERYYRSLGLALSREEYAEYLKDLDVFSKQVYAKFNKTSIVNRRMYQINFNLYPWTEALSGDQKRSTITSSACSVSKNGALQAPKGVNRQKIIQRKQYVYDLSSF